MILIIPNIVQNLYLHLSMPFILGLHPPYPTSPTYSKPCYPHLPPPPPPPPPPRTATPPPPSNFFFFLNFHKNFTSPFTSTLIPQSDADPPPRNNPPPPKKKKKKNFFFEFSQKLQFSNSLFPSYLTPPPQPDPPPPKKIFF